MRKYPNYNITRNQRNCGGYLRKNEIFLDKIFYRFFKAKKRLLRGSHIGNQQLSAENHREVITNQQWKTNQRIISLVYISQCSDKKDHKTYRQALIFKWYFIQVFNIIIQEMESIFEKLQGRKDLKDELRYWCRQNGIKVSFTVNMTFTKSKAIFRKLENTYKKGFGKLKTRWLENQLKLFHFALLAVSTLFQKKINEFAQEQWQSLIQAFPNKLQPILEYEAKNFTVNKNTLKQKWQEDEDRILTQIVQQKTEQPKWNEVATQLYIDSNRLFFRNGKQCRQRWLNHLDTAIKHQKWANQQDQILMKSVLDHGKKWSRIMRCFNNQRTQHMIKNRFLSLILRCKKTHPFIQDEETAIKKISQEMGLKSEDQKPYEDQLYSERRLRPKTTSIDKNYNIKYSNQEENEQNSYKISILSVSQEKNMRKNEVIIPEFTDHTLAPISEPYKINSNATLSTPSPSTFLSPISFVNCNQFFPGFGYFQYYMNDFYNQLSSNSNFSAQQ